MLQIIVPDTELFNEADNTIMPVKGDVLQLEHSLISISKWESKWHKPFLTKGCKTDEEVLDYIKCMTLNRNVDPDIYARLSNENLRQVKAYIDNPMTATTIPKDSNTKTNRETITSELIYYWMIALNIPPEYQKWHLNRLITLIDVCSFKNSPKKRRGPRRDMLAERARLNAERKQRLNTKG